MILLNKVLSKMDLALIKRSRITNAEKKAKKVLSLEEEVKKIKKELEEQIAQAEKKTKKVLSLEEEVKKIKKELEEQIAQKATIPKDYHIEYLQSGSDFINSLYSELPQASPDYLQQVFSWPGLVIRDDAIYNTEIQSQYANFKNGRRITIGNPKTFDHTVYLMGSSYVYGFGAEDAHTIPSLLQTIYNSDFPDKIRVLNYGAGGTNNEAFILQLHSLDLKPGDSVVIVLREKNTLVTTLAMHSFCQEKQVNLITLMYPRINEMISPSLRENILRSNSYEEILNQKPHKVLPTTRKKYVIPQKVLELTAQGCPCVDLQPFFDRPHDLGEIFIDKVHLNYKGNQKIANIIVSLLPYTKEDQNLAIAKKQHISEAQQMAINFISQVAVNQYKKNQDIQTWINKTLNPEFSNFDKIGAIVMNCNPFTNGHLHLIEHALDNSDGLYILVVEEDRSDFNFTERMEMIKQGTRHLSSKLTIVPSGKFIISSFSFPGYFTKSEVVEPADSTLDIVLFGSIIAPALNIKKRFVGEEPNCIVTASYNKRMEFFLPKMDVPVHIIPRKQINGLTVSASIVRQMITKNKHTQLRQLVPESTYLHLKNTGKLSEVSSEKEEQAREV